jgi:hypothetical protein
MAAARLRSLSVAEVDARLSDRFRLLTSGNRAVALPRQQTLRAALDWSYDLLTEPEKRLLNRLSVFVGGVTRAGAEAVSGLEDAFAVDDLLDSLMDKSLLVGDTVADPPRYRMLETVREYALERLRESGEEEAVRARHAEHYLALAEAAAPFLEKPEPAWLDRLETEHDNLRAALTRFTAREENQEQVDKAVRLAAALARFWNYRGHVYEQRTWLVGLARRLGPPTAARAEVLARAVFTLGSDFADARRMHAEMLAIARQLGDRRRIYGALSSLASLESDPMRARALAQESLAIARELGDRQGMADVLYQLGQMAQLVGDTDEARARWMECHRVDQEMGTKGGYVLRVLGDLARDCGDFAAARSFFRQFLTERDEIGDRWNVGWALAGFSTLALAEGEAPRAARLLGASLALCASSLPWMEEAHAQYEVLREAVREVLGDSALVAAEAEGRALTLEQAMQLALSERTA